MIEEQLVRFLKEKHLHIVTAESCTGGLVASGIINVTGASDVLSEGYITYSEEAKHRILGVSYQTIQNYNVVSQEVVMEMAAGAARVSGAEIALATTGLAGPGGGSATIPVGTVWLGCWLEDEVYVKKLQLQGTRAQIRQDAAKQALIFAWECLCSKKQAFSTSG